MAIDILSQIRARISELSAELDALRKAEMALGGTIIVGHPGGGGKAESTLTGRTVGWGGGSSGRIIVGHPEGGVIGEATPSVTEGILAALRQSGPMKKPDIETIIRSSRSHVGKQTVAGTLQALRRRGKVKLLKGGKWTLTPAA